jgi:hypothetical protein
MEAIFSSETSVDIQRTTQRYIPEDRTLHNQRCENLESYSLMTAGLPTEIRVQDHPNTSLECYRLSHLALEFVEWFYG